MLDPVRTALSRVFNIIPMPVLQSAFQSEEYMDVSLDELIIQKVIQARVLDDVSQRCGKVKDIVMQLGWVKYTSPPSNFTLAVSGAFSTFHIPPEARDFRDILTVHAVRFPYTLSRGGSAAILSDCVIGGNTASQLACAALQAQTKAGMVSMPQAQVLPGNVIKLTPETISFTPWIITCRLKYDLQFTGMDINVIQTFNQVVEMAVKAYIYKELIFKIESNVMTKGYELGVIKDIVSGYSDANDKYDELLIAMNIDIFSPSRLRAIVSKIMPVV